MIRWVFLPVISYILMIPFLVFVQTIFGKEVVGDYAIEEYLIVLSLVFFWEIFKLFRNRGFTSGN
jgi:purine-cytosine permease-like protein